MAIKSILTEKHKFDSMAAISSAISHEAFHAYIFDRYRQADDSSVLADRKSSVENMDPYYRDRAEMATRLYTASYLSQRINQIGDNDSQLVEAMQRELDRTKEEIEFLDKYKKGE